MRALAWFSGQPRCARPRTFALPPELYDVWHSPRIQERIFRNWVVAMTLLKARARPMHGGSTERSDARSSSREGLVDEGAGGGGGKRVAAFFARQFFVQSLVVPASVVPIGQHFHSIGMACMLREAVHQDAHLESRVGCDLLGVDRGREHRRFALAAGQACSEISGVGQ